MSTDPPDTWTYEELRAGLAGTRFHTLQHFAAIASTNTFAVQQAGGGAADGCVYFADEQTAGRGRGGHSWHSAPGEGLYVSALVRPKLAAAAALWISLAAGLAVHRAVSECTGLTADIRWPNDLLLGERKFCGILTETSMEGDALRYAVIGIGINVGQRAFPPELEEIATSLRIASGHTQPRQPLFIALLRALDGELAALEDSPSGVTLMERLRAASTWVEGKRVDVPENGGYTGVTAGLDARGFLRVQMPQGVRTVLLGGVRAAQ